MRFNTKTRRMEKVPVEELNSEKEKQPKANSEELFGPKGSSSHDRDSRRRRRSRSRSRDRSRKKRTRRGFGDRPAQAEMSTSPSSKYGGGPPMTLRVHGLHEGSYNGTIMLIQLRDKFSEYGVVKDADVPVNPTGRVRGFAYITMDE